MSKQLYSLAQFLFDIIIIRKTCTRCWRCHCDDFGCVWLKKSNRLTLRTNRKHFERFGWLVFLMNPFLCCLLLFSLSRDTKNPLFNFCFFTQTSLFASVRLYHLFFFLNNLSLAWTFFLVTALTNVNECSMLLQTCKIYTKYYNNKK